MAEKQQQENGASDDAMSTGAAITEAENTAATEQAAEASGETPGAEQEEPGESTGDNVEKLAKALKRERAEVKRLSKELADMKAQQFAEKTREIVTRFNLHDDAAKVLEKFPTIEERLAAAKHMKPKAPHIGTLPIDTRNEPKRRVLDGVPTF